jgi:hypothetical protein
LWNAYKVLTKLKEGEMQICYLDTSSMYASILDLYVILATKKDGASSG